MGAATSVRRLLDFPSRGRVPILMRTLCVFGVWLWLILGGGVQAAPGGSALERMERPPAGWQGPKFTPHFAYPARAKEEVRPWEALSFRKAPEAYLRALLAYALEGQDRVDWRLQANKVRGWYHVPWLGPGPNGREFSHGLTRARDLQAGELGPQQKGCRQTWVVAFYNPAGGAVLGRVWRNVARGRGAPDLSALPFPVGTVAVKLVFTNADARDDMRLTGAPEIVANIHRDDAPGDGACAGAVDASGKPAARAPTTLRLVQFDVAVREGRARYKTGWVYGSFLFDGRKAGADPWAKLAPIGLMWGNDPQLSDAAFAEGDRPRQSIVFAGHPYGRAGRMNGIADARSSACSSCHMAAQWPSVAPIQAPAEWQEARCWFRNLDATYPFGFSPTSKQGCANTKALAKTQSLDFSLQLAIGLRNWSMARAKEGHAIRTTLGALKRDGETLTVNGETSLPLRR